MTEVTKELSLYLAADDRVEGVGKVDDVLPLGDEHDLLFGGFFSRQICECHLRREVKG